MAVNVWRGIVDAWRTDGWMDAQAWWRRRLCGKGGYSMFGLIFLDDLKHPIADFWALRSPFAGLRSYELNTIKGRELIIVFLTPILAAYRASNHLRKQTIPSYIPAAVNTRIRSDLISTRSVRCALSTNFAHHYLPSILLLLLLSTSLFTIYLHRYSCPSLPL